jgi:hypothetical protein
MVSNERKKFGRVGFKPGALRGMKVAADICRLLALSPSAQCGVRATSVNLP